MIQWISNLFNKPADVISIVPEPEIEPEIEFEIPTLKTFQRRLQSISDEFSGISYGISQEKREFIDIEQFANFSEKLSFGLSGLISMTGLASDKERSAILAAKAQKIKEELDVK